MKKNFLIFFIFILSILCLVACTKKSITLSGDESSILIKNDGSCQSLLVEEIDDNMTDINIEDLKKFIEKELSDFSKDGDVKLLDIDYKKPKLKLLFGYTSLDKLLSYAKYSNDDSIGFESIKFVNKDDEILRPYINDKTEAFSRALIVKGTGSLKFEAKVIEAINGENNSDFKVEISDSHSIKIASTKSVKATDIETIILIK